MAEGEGVTALDSETDGVLVVDGMLLVECVLL